MKSESAADLKAEIVCARIAVEAVAKQYGDWFAALPRESLCHGDPSAPNIMRRAGDQSLILLDWEMATVNHPAADLAAHFSVETYTPEQEAEFLAAYGTPIDPDVLWAFKVARQFLMMSMFTGTVVVERSRGQHKAAAQSARFLRRYLKQLNESLKYKPHSSAAAALSKAAPSASAASASTASASK